MWGGKVMEIILIIGLSVLVIWLIRTIRKIKQTEYPNLEDLEEK